jgi:hypothetical protein
VSEESGLTLDYLPCGKNGSATVTARLGDDILAHAKVDFSKPGARTRFASDVTKGRPGIDGPTLEKELLRIGAELSARRATIDEAPPAQPDAHELLMKMPQHVRDQAREMLESKGLLDNVAQDVQDLGIAGEQELIKTIYLAATSRKLPDPVKLIISSGTSTGKTITARKTTSCIPSEDVIDAGSMTARALYYFPDPATALRHKLIVSGERKKAQSEEQADATAALRQLLSDHKLTMIFTDTSVKPPVTRRLEIEGPVSYLETTTSSPAEIFNEDLNRCLLLSADERPEQTRRVIYHIAEARAGARPLDTDAIVQKHHALQRMLQQRGVLTPFATQLALEFKSDRPEARRAFGQLLAMVEASALLHQFQRQLDTDGRIIATLEDYEVARDLCLTPLARLLGGQISAAAIRFHERLLKWDKSAGEFSTTDAYKFDGKSDRAVLGWLKELVQIGAAEQTHESKGSRAARWRLTAMPHNEVEAGGFELPELDPGKEVPF